MPTFVNKVISTTNVLETPYKVANVMAYGGEGLLPPLKIVVSIAA
jgi:hypothetical protein